MRNDLQINCSVLNHALAKLFAGNTFRNEKPQSSQPMPTLHTSAELLSPTWKPRTDTFASFVIKSPSHLDSRARTLQVFLALGCRNFPPPVHPSAVTREPCQRQLFCGLRAKRGPTAPYCQPKTCTESKPERILRILSVTLWATLMSPLPRPETGRKRACSDTASITCSSCKPKTAFTLSESSRCTRCFEFKNAMKNSAQTGGAMSFSEYQKCALFFVKLNINSNTTGTHSASQLKVSRTHMAWKQPRRHWPNTNFAPYTTFGLSTTQTAAMLSRSSNRCPALHHIHDQEQVEPPARRWQNPRSCDFPTCPPICTSDPCCRRQSL